EVFAESRMAAPIDDALRSLPRGKASEVRVPLLGHEDVDVLSRDVRTREEWDDPRVSVARRGRRHRHDNEPRRAGEVLGTSHPVVGVPSHMRGVRTSQHVDLYRLL